MSGTEGVRRNGPTERLVLMGANQAKTCREVTYNLSQGDYIKFILPQMRELEKGGITREGTIEIGAEPKISIKIAVTKSALFRFNQQTDPFDNFLAIHRSGGKPVEVLEDLQKCFDSLISLGQVITLLRLDEPGRPLSPEAKPIIKAILDKVTMLRSRLDSRLTNEEMAYLDKMETTGKEHLGFSPSSSVL